MRLLRRREGASSSLSYQIKILRADGPGGAPGSLVSSLNGQANGIGTQPTLFTHVLTPFDILTPATNFYVAMSWNAGSVSAPDHSLCFDGSVPPSHPIFFKPAAGSAWDSKAEVFPTTPIRALGIRAEVAPAGGGGGTCAGGPCIEDDNHVCLAGNRFRLSAAFDPPNDADTLLELARAERLTSDTGYFTFFDVNNVEAVVKVLNACPVNDRFWVFAGGLTNVLTEITVCDTATGSEKKYTNPQTTPFQPIQDTAAFATCP